MKSLTQASRSILAPHPNSTGSLGIAISEAVVPEGIHAGGLRDRGMAPLMSHVVALGLAQARLE